MLLLSVVWGASSATAADYHARGVAYCILDDGSGTFPVDEAGEVFVGTTPDDTPTWAAGSYASTTITGPMAGGQASVKFYYWARAKEGYTFLGWGTTKTSKSGSSGTDRLENQPWESKTTLWTAGTEAAPKELVRYAIFRKNAAEDTTGGGVALQSVTGNSHTCGSTIDEWSVRLIYEVSLAYKDFGGYGDGYGVNTSLISAITCISKTDGTAVSIKTARVGGSPTGKGADAYGLIYFPADLPVGTYSVHVPKGLFTTSLGTVTAAADFEVTVTPDNTPFTIESTTPAEGYAWDASESTQAKETDGNFSVITLTFNKNIARVETEGKNIVLLNTTTGRESKFTVCSVSATSNKRLAVIAFDSQADGSYTFTLPKNVFYDGSGKGNGEFTLHFKVSGSQITPWALPLYTKITSTPANNATVHSLKEVRVAFSRPGFADPIMLSSNSNVRVQRAWEEYKDGVDYSDPDSRPTVMTEYISDVTTAFMNGELVITLPEEISDDMKVLVTIPENAVINLSRGRLTNKELVQRGACINPEHSIMILVKRVGTTAVDAATAPQAVTVEAYTLDGRPVSVSASSGASPAGSLRIVRTVNANGEVSVRKVLVK